MGKPDDVVAFKAVFADELREIAQRRRTVELNEGVAEIESLADSLNGGDSRCEHAPPMVGLALSGGGIRSASFNLGVLQSLYKRHILRHVDYLSTVSGGGYIGAALTAEIARFRQDKAIEWKPTEAPDQQDEREPLSLLYDGTRAQPKRVLALVHRGLYLRKLTHFWSRYLWGLIAINGFALSVLICVCATLAALFRALDYESAIRWAAAAGFVGDMQRALLPATVVFLIWFSMFIVTSAVGWWLKIRSLGDCVRSLSVIMILLAAMGLAIVLSTRDISQASFEVLHLPPPDPGVVRSVSRNVEYVLLAILGLTLLPYIRPTELLRSGTRPKNAVEGIIFTAASYGLLVGVPLAVFAYLAREDISRSNATRMSRHELTRVSTPNWAQFWERVEHEAGLSSGLGFPSEISKAVLEAANKEPGYSTALEQDREIRRNDAKNSKAKLWWAFLTGGETIKDRNSCRERIDALKNAIMGHINTECLASPDFHAHFEKVTPELTWWAGDDARLQMIAELRSEARLAKDESALQLANRNLLNVWYGDLLRDEARTVLAYHVVEKDQSSRWNIILWSGAAALLFGLVSLNRTSIHSFYKAQIGRMWLHESPYERHSMPLHALRTTHRGGPYHLIIGAANLFDKNEDDGLEPTAPFIFSSAFCGVDRPASKFGYRRTPKGRLKDQTWSVANALAVSGAAFNPRIVNNWLLVSLLFLTNTRLGQWMECPARRERRPFHPLTLLGWIGGLIHCVVRWPAPIPIVLSTLGNSWTPGNRRYNFVSDGGHHENLGVEPLLRRRCRMILAFDVSQDESYSFSDLVRQMRRCRVHYGLKFTELESDRELDLDNLSPHGPERLSRRHHLLIKVAFPPDPELGLAADEGILIYCKPTFDGDEPVDLLQYRRESTIFPHDPTLDQFYDPRRFECYRQLGEHIADQIAKILPPQTQLDGAAPIVATWSPPKTAGLRSVLELLFADEPRVVLSALDQLRAELKEEPDLVHEALLSLRDWLERDRAQRTGDDRDWHAIRARVIELIDSVHAILADTGDQYDGATQIRRWLGVGTP